MIDDSDAERTAAWCAAVLLFRHSHLAHMRS
jgi:hypothetical protein